jgi:hypothetical protein
VAAPVSPARPSDPLTAAAPPTAAADVAAPARPERARVAAIVAPVALALFPTLNLAADNFGNYAGKDLAVIIAAIAAVVLLALGVVRLLASGARRSPRRLELASVATVVLVGWFFYYLPLQRALQAVVWPVHNDWVFVPLCLVGTIAVVGFLASRWGPPLTTTVRLLCMMGVILDATSSARLVSASRRSSRALEGNPVVRAWNEPVSPAPAAPLHGVRRDVYLIVLDGYPNERVLRERWQFDNRAFVDSLRALGFVIPRYMHSNYTQTILSLPSLLNFEHNLEWARDQREDTYDRTLPKHLIADNRAARFLKAQGYRYHFFPSQWWDATRRTPLADVTYEGPAAFSLSRELRRTELHIAVLYSTLLYKIGFSRSYFDIEYPLDAFRALAELPERREPTFTFAHMLIPHQPIMFDAACGPVANRMLVGDDLAYAGDADQFRGQLRCVNTLTLRLLTDLLRRSETPPIIAVVGDHGTLSRGWSSPTVSRDYVAQERFGAFGAFYMPDGGGEQFRDTVSLVNVFRKVFRHYWGVPLPPASDDLYYSEHRTAYRFERVSPSVVHGPESGR